MNYAGKFDATLSGDGAGTHDSPAYIHIDPPHAQVPKDAIVVPDAHLLFNADFKRSGVDLILSKDDHELVLHDYFKGEKRAPLASPDGAHLTGDLVNALTGAVQYSQAGGAPAAASQVIGHVTKLAGNATAIRNGVSIILHQGDNVEKGDVVQAGADSTLGITFIDGSVFGLASNARMVLNEMVYDPNGSNNSSLISLVAGTISFVAGETAKHGDMKVDTPVATMGIRGTAVLVEIDFTIPQGADHPDAKYQVLVEPDGTTGSYILFDKTTLQPIAVVNQAGQQVNISNGVVSTSASQLSPDLQKLIAEVFTQKFASTDDTHSNTHLTDSINPNLITGQTIKTADGTTATPIFQVTGSTTGSSPGGSTGSNGLQHIDQAPKASAASETVTEVLKTTGSNTLDLAFNKVSFDDINVGDQPTVSTSFDHFTYTDANGKAVPNLNALQTADIKATEVDLVVVQDPANGHVGAATWTYLIPDHAFDFLAAGEKLTLTYTALVDSNYAPNDLKTPVQFTITITGTNDVPVITSDQQTQLIQFAAGTSTQGGPLQVFNGEQTSGTFPFTDPDLTDTHQITDTHGAPSNIAILTSASLVVDGQTLDLAALEARYPTPMTAFEQALSVAVGSDSTGTGNGTISWKLADLPVYLADFIPKDQKLTLTYTITLMDSQGATDTKTVEVTIGGTDNAAEVWIHTVGDGNDNLWTTGKNWETGNVPVATDDVIIVTNQLHPITDPSQPNAPVYPATITAGTNAVANSVTMNDFTFPQSPGDPPPLPPVLEVQAADAQHSAGSLSIGTTLAMSADSVLNNAGTVNVGTQIELLDGSVPNKSQITNSGTLNLDTSKVAQAGDIQGNASIINTGTIDLKGGTLNVLVGVANVQGDSAGQIIVDAGATLVLGTDPKNGPGVVGGITGGTVTINGTLELQGTSFLKNGIFVNDNQVNVTGTGTALENEKVTNDGNIDISGALLVDPTTIDNTKGTIQVDGSGGTLMLNDATITGGTVTNNGTLDLTGTALLKNGTVGNFGQINVSSSGNALDGETVTANHALEILAGGALTIDHGSTVANSSGTITIDAAGNGLAAATLNLNDATITGGTVTDNGLIDVIGDSKIDGNATLNNGAVTVESGIKLTLDNVTVTGTTITDKGSIELDGTVKLTGSATIEGVSNASKGAITNLGTLEVSGSATLLNDTLTNTGKTIQVDDGQTLILSGTEIIGGTINDFSGALGGTIHVTGASEIDGGATLNKGAVTVDSSQTLTLDNVTVTGTAITDTDLTSIVQVDHATTLTLQGGATIKGGSLTNLGTVDIESSSGASLDGVSIANGSGNIQVDSPIPPLPSTLVVDDGTTIKGGTVTIGSAGTFEVKTSLGATLDGASVDSSGAVQVDAGSELDLKGATIIGGSVTILGTGSIVGFGTISDALVNYGTLEAKGGTLDVTGAVSGTGGSAKIDQEATLELGGPSAQGVLFSGSAATLKLDDPLHFSGHITGLVIGDTIEVATAANVAVTTATLDGSTLTVTESNGQILTFNVAGQLIENDFHINNLAGGGADLVLSADPLAETPSLAGTPTSVTGPEDTAIPLSISAALSADASNDPDSSLSLKIAGIPADATLSNTKGDPLSVADDGSISFTADQLAAGVLTGLSITPHSADEAGFTLHVTATNTDGTGATASVASTSQDIAVNLTPVADAPSLVVADASGAEDTAIGLSIAPALSADVDPDSSLSLKITGIPADATLSNTNGNTLSVVDGSISFTADQLAAGVLSGLSITPHSADEAGFTLHVMATNTDGTASAATSHDIHVTVTPVADPPSLVVADASGAEDTAIGLSIAPALSADVDPDSSLSLKITGIPADATLSNTNGNTLSVVDGSISFTADQLAAGVLSGLSITPHSADEAGFTLHVTATNTDGTGATASVASTSQDIAVNLTPVADPPSLVVADASGAEDTAIGLSIAPALSADVDPDSSLSLKITGIPADATLSNTNGNTLSVVDGSISFTADQLAAGVLSGLSITPHSADEAGFTLHVTATNTDGTASAATSHDIHVTVTPVAEAPSLAGTVTTVSGAEETPIGLTIHDALSGESDADAVLGSITISKVPAGVTLSAGTSVAAGEGTTTWTLTSAQLSGLTLTGDGETKNFSLHVDATTNDGGNIAHATTDIAVTVNPVADAPSLAGTQTTVNVNEDSSASLTIVDALSEVDRDSSLGAITISGVPTGVTFNHGHSSANHTWTLDPATDLAGLRINIPDNDQGNFTLSVVGTTNDGGNIATSAPTSIAISLNAPSLAGTPTTVSLPKHTGEGQGSANFKIVDTLNDPSDPDASLGTVTISGVPTDVTFNHGHAGANHTWTLTAAQLSGLKILYPNGTQNFTLTVVATSDDAPSNGASAPLSIAVNIAPAGEAGHPINLALANAFDGSGPTTVTITAVPAGWNLNGGTNLGNGTWTVQTGDPGSLTITPAANFAGAVQLGVTESSTLANGSISTFSFSDNLEAYSAGSPIFALSGDDHLSGAGANDLFVFSQPIGNDIIYNFNAASDKIDLIGFKNFRSFSDILANLTDDANGNAVIAFGISETITLQGVHAASLIANDFVFEQVPVTTNAGSVVISDGATLPLSGMINNTGTIALNSTGTETDLQIIEHGITLEGGGQVILSDSAENVISGTSADVTLTNVDNTIDGGGDLGGGRLTLVNDSHGVIAATAFNQLTIDTGAGSFTNHGLVLSNGAGGLEVKGDIFSDGMLEARAGLLKIDGDVSGGGHAVIDGGSIEFGAASDAIVQFSGSSGGTLVLDDATHFSGRIAGISGSGDVLDLKGFDAVHDAVVASTGAGSYDSATDTTSLLVRDQTTDQSVTLKLAGDYSASTWTVSDDHKGGVNIVDQPAPASNATAPVAAQDPAPAPSQTIVASAPNETLTGTATNDTFVFNFAAVGHDTVTDFHPGADALQFSSTIFNDAQALLSATQDDGHGNTVVALDPQDTITLTGILKAQLHSADFHFV